MFNAPGIDAADVAWIERDQFIYFMQMEHQLNDPADWPRFRAAVVEVLSATLGGAALGPVALTDGLSRQVRPDPLVASLDAVRSQHDPATEWDRFLAGVWTVRQSLRPGDRTSYHRPARRSVPGH